MTLKYLHTMVRVSNLDQALDFYCRKLGLVEVRRKEDKLPPGYAQPIEVRALDAATEQEVGGSVWGRIFPFLLVMMSLTGAFYPAVDLCAGEKERGTMETLLISPASRAEIVVGKFLCVLLASVTTAVLNLASMGLTGLQMAQRASGFGGSGANVRASVGASSRRIMRCRMPHSSNSSPYATKPNFS